MIKNIRDIIQHNFIVKLLSLIVAVVLWIMVMNEQNPIIEGTFTVPILSENAPEGYRIAVEKDVVRLKVKAPRSLFVSAGAKDFQAILDLSGIIEGEQKLHIQVVLPQGFELTEGQTFDVAVTSEAIIQKQLPLEISTTGVAPAGRTVAKINHGTRNVIVEGPRSAVEQAVGAVGYINISGNGEDFMREVALSALNKDGREVAELRLAPESTQVGVQYARGLTKKIVTVIPMTDAETASGMEFVSAKAEPEKVEIAGDSALIEGISSIPTELISLRQLESSGTVTARLMPPIGVILTNPNINVKIELRKKAVTE